MSEDNKAPDSNAPRLKMGQSSVGGLNVFSGKIIDERDYMLRWPLAMKTYSTMMKDATVAPAIQLVEMAISRVPWVVKVPEGMDSELKEQKKFLEQVMSDMEQPWTTFIRQVASFNTYGFAAVEKVYRRRTYEAGSKYNDGKIGLKKLAPIAQVTINDWIFSKDGRDLIGLTQRPTHVSNRDETINIERENQLIEIPRKKFLLFRNNPINENPEGTSPLNSCYVAWRYKTELEKAESLGVSQDLRGLKVLYLPPQYLAQDADEEMREVREYYERGLSMIHKNEQSAIILPQIFDDDGNKQFELELKSIMGQKAHDTDTIINRYRKDIVTALFASQLILGQEGGGSYSLAESQASTTKMVIDSRLTEIRDQLNHDLIPQLFKLNGFDVTVTPYFDFGEIAEESLDEISKFIQRIGAVGLIPKTAPMVNFITDRLGAPRQFTGEETTEGITPKLTGYESGAAEGMESGTGSGTSKKASTRDSSVSNSENS